MGHFGDKRGVIHCGTCKTWHASTSDCKSPLEGVFKKPDGSYTTGGKIVESPIPVKWPGDEEPLDLAPFIEKMDVGDVAVTRLVGGVEISLVDRDGFGHSYEMLDSEFYDAMLNQIIQRPTINWGLLVGVVACIVVWCSVIAGVI